jgi:hypothetical protein
MSLKAKTNAKDNENDREHVSAKSPRDKVRNMPINYITFNQDSSVLGLGTYESMNSTASYLLVQQQHLAV